MTTYAGSFALSGSYVSGSLSALHAITTYVVQKGCCQNCIGDKSTLAGACFMPNTCALPCAFEARGEEVGLTEQGLQETL